MDNTSTRPDHLIVIVIHTPGAHPTCSAEIGWWLPVIGPTASVLAVTLAHSASEREAEWNTLALARTVGIGASRSKLWVSLERLAQFGCARFESTDTSRCSGGYACSTLLPSNSSKNWRREEERDCHSHQYEADLASSLRCTGTNRVGIAVPGRYQTRI